MKTWIILPAFNEEKDIFALVKEIKRKGFSILAIDDGSKDKTFCLLKEAGVDILLQNDRNLGKGASIRKGINYLFAQRIDFDALVLMDADAQHLPSEIEEFQKELEKGAYFVVGNRMNNPRGMPWLRILTNRIMSYIISCLVRQNIPDTQCGFKAIRREVLERLKIKTSRYEVDSELILKAAFLGFKIKSIPVESIYGVEKSRINPFLDTLRFLIFLLNITRDGRF